MLEVLLPRRQDSPPSASGCPDSPSTSRDCFRVAPRRVLSPPLPLDAPTCCESAFRMGWWSCQRHVVRCDARTLPEHHHRHRKTSQFSSCEQVEGEPVTAVSRLISAARACVLHGSQRHLFAFARLSVRRSASHTTSQNVSDVRPRISYDSAECLGSNFLL